MSILHYEGLFRLKDGCWLNDLILSVRIEYCEKDYNNENICFMLIGRDLVGAHNLFNKCTGKSLSGILEHINDKTNKDDMVDTSDSDTTRHTAVTSDKRMVIDQTKLNKMHAQKRTELNQTIYQF